MSSQKLTRRAFLRTAGAGVAGITLTACTLPAPSSAPAAEGDAAPAQTQPYLRWLTDHYGGRRGEASDFAIARFKEMHPEIEVVYEPVPEVAERMMVEMATGKAPDIFLSSDDLMLPYGHLVMDLTPFYERDDDISVDDFMPIPPSFTREGKIFAVPYQGNVQGFWINVDLFEQAAVPMPWEYDHNGDKWWDWTDFLETTREIRGLGEDLYGYMLTNRFEWGYLSWVLSNGGFWVDEGSGARIATYIDPEKNVGTFSSPATQEALKFCMDMLCEYDVAMPFEQYQVTNTSLGVSPFEAGLTGSAEQASEGGIKASERNIMRVAFPRSPATGESHTGLNNQPHQITKDTNFPDEAWAFAKFMASYEIQWKAAVELGGFDPSRRDIYSAPDYYTDWPEISKEAKIEQLDQGGYRPMFNRFWEWVNEFHSIMDEVGACEMSLAEGTAELDRVTTEILQSG